MKISEMSVELIDSMGSDLSVVNAARVSFAKESVFELKKFPNEIDGNLEYHNVLSEKDTKLINYLAKHNHWTPFAHAFASFRIKAPIFVARQLVKHQVGLAWNEVSRRYVDDEPEFFFPKVWRKRADNVKQGSSSEPARVENINIEKGMAWAMHQYNGLLEAGVAPEQARMVLPQNTMTEWIWSGSLAAFARVCKLRLDAHAQQETQDAVKMIYNQLMPIYPVSFAALLENKND